MPSFPDVAGPPDPGSARTLDDLVERLRLLKIWAGDPSYERITDRITEVWRAAGRPAAESARKTTVVDCFRPGRRRLNADLLITVVQVLHPDLGYVTQWQQALRVIAGETQAAAQVQVHDSLPPELPEFTGRTPELEQLRQSLRRAHDNGGAVVISAIEGMAGIGKTQLAIHAGHMLLREEAFDRVLQVNLRGFHPDPAQPPADPAAVLDGFLRLLGVPGQQIPHDLDARAAAYRKRLVGTRTLVVLDNAADFEQAAPLLPASAGSMALITSRHSLAGLDPVASLILDGFTPGEAVDFLTRQASGTATGTDPLAAARIAHRCGYLPLALGLVAGHIRGTPGWTLTDHADRLDERHRYRQLDSGVEIALQLSYQRLADGQQRLLRFAALLPGQDFDAYAIAAMAGTDLPDTREDLRRLCRDHLLQQVGEDRYSFHDLVRAFAANQAGNEDPPPHRREALTRLFGYYQTTAANAMAMVYSHERFPAVVPSRELADRKHAELWLDTELANLLAAAHHAAGDGWPESAWQLSAILDQHLRTRGAFSDAGVLHQNALNLARRLGNRPAEANALNGLGHVYRFQGSYEQASDHLGPALRIAEETGDLAGQLSALNGLGRIYQLQSNYGQASDCLTRALRIAEEIGDRAGQLSALNGLSHMHLVLGRPELAGEQAQQALRIAQEIGDRVGELNALNGLGHVYQIHGDHELAGDHLTQALRIARDIGDRSGQLNVSVGLGRVNLMRGDYEQAADHFGQTLKIAEDVGHRAGQSSALNGLGQVHLLLGQYGEAGDRYRQLLELTRETGNRNWQFEALHGLGRLHLARGESDLAVAHFEPAMQLAGELSQPTDQVRAYDGLAHAHNALNQRDAARAHWQQALDILDGLRIDHIEDIETSAIRANLARLDGS